MSHKRMKAVIPAAGLGTRFLPATKAMPKEMLPVVDKPAIQYVVEEAAQAGIRDILIIIGRNKNNLANHFDSVPELEEKLKDKGDHDRLQRVVDSSDLADIHFVRQGEPKGLGHAVLRARAHVGDASFAVLLGDDLIDERDPLLTTMIDEHERPRRERHRADGGRPRPDPPVRGGGRRAHRQPRRRQGDGPGREAVQGGRPVQPGRSSAATC